MNTRAAAAPALDDFAPDPSQLLGLATSFWVSKVLLAAVELDLFTALAAGPRSGEDLRRDLGLHPRGWRDFFDSLVSLGVLHRDEDGLYANSIETAYFLDRGKPTSIAGFMQMCEHRLYPFWGNLAGALRSGKAQNESDGADDFFPKIYAEPARLKGFLQAMTGISRGTARTIAQKFPWQSHRTFADIGCAEGCLPAEVASAHPHLTGTGFDLPSVAATFDAFIGARGLGDRVRFHGGDFLSEPLPEADVLVMGHILHDWDLEQKMLLLEKSWKALPRGGSLVVYEALIDDERRSNTFGLLMSLNMLIETSGGFDFTGADCCGWMKAAGFTDTRVEYLGGPDSMVVGTR